jgi:hypothetical protein
MFNEIQEFNAQADALRTRLEVWIKDTSVPLEERWNAACQASAILEHEGCGIHHLDSLVIGGEIAWYDHVGIDRYQTCVLMSDDFIDHFAQVIESEGTIKKYINEQGSYCEDYEVDLDTMVDNYGFKVTIKEEPGLVYEEGTYWHSVKLKPRVTKDQLKEAILLAGIFQFTLDW